MILIRTVLGRSLAGLAGVLMSGLAAAQQGGPGASCRDLPVAASAPDVTATIRGEFLKAGKTLIQDIYLSTPDGSRIRAFVIKPYNPVAEKGGAAFFLHWLGGPPANDRAEFYEDAMQLADHNVTSLLVDAPWADPAWFPGRMLDRDLENTPRYGAQLRSYFRYLLAEAKPDPEKVAFVGHDFGGMYGALLLEQEPTIRHAVVMAAVGDFADWFVLGRKLSEADSLRYRRQMAAVAPTQYLHCAQNVDVLFQFAESDPFVSREQAALLMAATPKNSALWYPGGHELQDVSRKDRLEWLIHRIGASTTGN